LILYSFFYFKNLFSKTIPHYQQSISHGKSVTFNKQKCARGTNTLKCTHGIKTNKQGC